MMKDLDRLQEYLAGLVEDGLCVAFSGGTDSALLLKAACMAAKAASRNAREAVHAVTLFTPFHPPLEPAEAAALAQGFGAVHTVIEVPELPEEVLHNPPDRCYRCKRALFARIADYASTHGLAHVLDGTNGDDREQYRPGLRALAELGVRSPLADLGFSKAQVRAMAGELGLAVADKPSAPCLATRFPYHQAINPVLLPGIDRIETAVRALGPRVVRARVHGDTIRLEVQPFEFDKVLQSRVDLLEAVRREGFVHLTLDLAGYRTGSSFDDAYRSCADVGVLAAADGRTGDDVR